MNYKTDQPSLDSGIAINAHSEPEQLLEKIEQLTSQIVINERDRQTQRALYRIADITTGAEDMDAFYSALHEIVTELTSTDAFFIALYHEAEQAISFPYYEDHYDDCQSDKQPLKNREMIPLEDCLESLTYRVIRTNQVIRIIDPASSPISSIGKSSQDWLGIPLCRDGKPIGVFCIQSYQVGFRYTDNEVELMTFISRHISTALQRRWDAASVKNANQELKATATELELANEQLKLQIEEREQISQRLVELSHQAGKAEVATGVLHNVGNILNSLNVSANLIEETHRLSHLSSLKKAADLLAEQDDLTQFLTEDKRGKAFTDYLSKLAEKLLTEQSTALTELKTLNKHLTHVKTVVAMQQSYAGVSALFEEVSLPELFDDASLLIASSLARHDIQVVREYEDLPMLLLEKQKVLQVLVNLLKNAKDSMVQGREDGRQLIIRTKRIQDDRLMIEFQDNGSGIAKENLIKIFSHGFTTKVDGHGFGLHSCANATREMGGDLYAASDGVGCGATFTIELPFRPASD